MTMIDISDTERKIAERVDPAAAGAVELSRHSGGLEFSNMGEAMNFAKIMAISGVAVPKYLRGNVGGCMAITIQAVEWKLSPFAVANKSFSVNDRIGYESQLVQAVVLQRAPIKGRFKVEFHGDGEKRRCIVTAALKDGTCVDYTSPEIGKIPVKNSPLWKNDPDQQLFYYSGRMLCRRHFPDVLLGIYTPDELASTMDRRAEHARDVTPRAAPCQPLPDPPYDPPESAVAAALKNLDLETGEIMDPKTATWVKDGQPLPGEILSKEDATEAGELAPYAHPMSEALNDALNDPTGEKAVALLAQKLNERNGPLETQRLLDDARAAAKGGAAIYQHWENRLNAPDFERLTKHRAALVAEADAADTKRGA